MCFDAWKGVTSLTKQIAAPARVKLTSAANRSETILPQNFPSGTSHALIMQFGIFGILEMRWVFRTVVRNLLFFHFRQTVEMFLTAQEEMTTCDCGRGTY